MLGSPADGYIDPKVEDYIRDEHNVDSQHAEFQRQGGARIARTGYRLEVDVGRNHEQICRTEYP